MTAPLDLPAIRARADGFVENPFMLDTKLLQLAKADVPALLAEVERLSRHHDELRRRSTEDLDLRGLLSPNGGESVVPFELGPSLVPALEWLVGEVERLRAEVAARLNEDDYDPAPIILEYDRMAAERDAYRAVVDAGRALRAATLALPAALDVAQQTVQQPHGSEPTAIHVARIAVVVASNALDRAVDALPLGGLDGG